MNAAFPEGSAMPRTWVLTVACLILGFARAGLSEELELDPQPTSTAAAEEIKGGMLFRFVPLNKPTENLEEHLFWRTFEGAVAAEAAPIKLLIDNQPVIAPKEITIKDRGQALQYPLEGHKDLSNGKHVIVPGDIAIVMTSGKITSAHPAIKSDENEVRVLCAPVRLEALDANGVAVPTSINLSFGKERLLRSVEKFSVLTVWLPIGVKYASTLGSFSVGADGKVSALPAELAKDVTVTPEGLRLLVSTPPAAPPRTQTLSRVFAHPLPGGKGTLNCYFNPVVKPGEAARVTFSKKQFESGTGSAFVANEFTYAFPNGSGGACGVEKAVADAALIASELQMEAAELVQLKIPSPAWTATGVMPFKIENKKLGTISQTLVYADPAASLYVIPHRLRSVFTDAENAGFTVLLKPNFPGGSANVICKSDAADAKPLTLGTLQLPAVAGKQFDSRLFAIKTSALPAGNYQLWVEAGGVASSRVPLSIVSWYFRSPFLVHEMPGCAGAWPTDDEGLKVLQDAGVEMISSGGFGSIFKASDMPGVDQALAAALRDELGMPVETAQQRCPADFALQDMLKHHIRIIDFYPRGENFYLEGLSYHHSFKPSVDRMIRRLQIFTQQTMDYPSLWGMNYSWFPALFGYSEGGLDTDIHKRDRNAALAANLKQAGLENLTADERNFYLANAFSDDEAKRAKSLELMQKATRYWKAQMDFGFGRHNKLYNDAVRDVQPGAACVLFENAGHDELKRTRSLFNDMTAMTYESYSDYPEWPMSSSFTTDWGRGNFPGRPLWVTMDPGNSSEGQMKSLFHAFGRGAAGAGTVIVEPLNLQEIKRRTKGHQFVAQYGAIATRGTPDHRFAILSTAAQQVFVGRTQYAYHAMYYHLTRLGCAPVIVDDEDVGNAGIPAGTQVLFLVRQQQPLEPKVLSAIKAFTDKGGKVIVTGDTKVKIDGSIVAGNTVKNIWDLGGFVSHPQLWEEFEKNWEKPLTEALAKAGVPPAAKTDPHRGVVVSVDSGSVRYVVVISDEENQSWAVFKPNPALPVSLEGTGWTVRDLVKQQLLKGAEKDGRTDVSVDLITEPVTVLALYKEAPSAVTIKVQGDVHAGGDLVLNTEVLAGAKPLGAVPIQVDITDAAGVVRFSAYRGAGDEIRCAVPGLDVAGNWTIKVQEQITGVTATAAVAVGAAVKAEAALTSVGDVHVVNADHLHKFMKRTSEKRIVVEPGQEKFLPVARKLADDLTAAGVKTTVWQTKADDYDTLPIRWYPREDEDVPRWNLLNAGKMIAVRENMKPYVDTVNRAHIPEKGGYGEVNPPYMVGFDCILFSGGRLAESLRAQTPWMETPNVPGKGQGRLVVCFSPFLANFNALALVANDEAGTSKAAAELLNFAKPAAAAVVNAPGGEWKSLTPTVATAPVVETFAPYSPLRHVRNLWATRDGKTVVCLDSKNDTLAFVDPAGKVVASVATEVQDLKHSHIDDGGRFWTCTSKHTSGEWYMQELTFHCIGPDGTQHSDSPVYNGSVYFDTLPTDYPGGFNVAPNGTTMLLGLRGGFQLGDVGTAKWNRFADEPFVPVRDAIRHPRFPVGSAFSPDSKYVLLTMDTRPPGWGGMNMPAEHPCASATFLFDTVSEKVLWQLRDDEIRKSTYAVHTGFGAVSRDGSVAAIADYRGSVYVVDKTGAIQLQEVINTKIPERFASGPIDGVGVWMSESGNLTAAAFKNLLLVINGKHVERVKLPAIATGCVSRDGTLAVAALESGEVEAFDAEGKPKWVFNSNGVAPFLAPVNDNSTLVATSEGDLVLLDAGGKEVRRTHLLETTEQARHEVKNAADFKPAIMPQAYREPDTLDVAKKLLGAKAIAAWKPAGAAVAAFNRTFYPATEKITLTGDSPRGEAFLHLVYRRLPTNKSLTVVVPLGKEGTEVFDLDLETPEYRVIDIPVQGVKPVVNVIPTGPTEIAECTLYSMQWPSPNLALVKQTKTMETSLEPDKLDDTADSESKADAALMELKGEDGIIGKMKNCAIFVPNPDVDKISGAFLRAGVDALKMVDGKRFGNAHVPAWKPGLLFMGSWMTIDFAKPVTISLVATYDRAQKQSLVNQNIAVFSIDGTREKVLNGITINDQYWCVFPTPAREVKTLGVHIIAPKDEGLSEIEAYQSLEK